MSDKKLLNLETATDAMQILRYINCKLMESHGWHVKISQFSGPQRAHNHPEATAAFAC